MPELIWVQPGKEDGRVALFEQNVAHPGGEAWVARAGVAVQVARTLLVERKLARGELVEVAAPAPQAKPEIVKPPRKTKAEIEAEIAAARGEPSTPASKPSAPWAGYDDMPVEDVIARLRGLDQSAREAALAYERGHKNRATILRVNWNS